MDARVMQDIDGYSSSCVNVSLVYHGIPAWLASGVLRTI